MKKNIINEFQCWYNIFLGFLGVLISIYGMFNGSLDVFVEMSTNMFYLVLPYFPVGIFTLFYFFVKKSKQEQKTLAVMDILVPIAYGTMWILGGLDFSPAWNMYGAFYYIISSIIFAVPLFYSLYLRWRI
jgi:hypothetical protein